MSEALAVSEHGPMAARKLTLSDWAVLAAAIGAPSILGSVSVLGHFLVLPLMDEFHSTRAAVLFFLGVGAIGGNLLAPIVGRLLTKIPPWILMLIGAVVAGGGLILGSLAPSLVLVAAAFVAALAIGCLLCGPITCQTVIVRRLPNVLGRAVAAQAMTGAVIAIAMPLIVAPYLTAYGWRATLATAGIIAIVLAPALILSALRKEGVSATVAVSAHAPTPALVPQSDASALPPTTRQILTSPAFWLLLIALEPIAMVLGSLIPNLIPIYHDRGVGLNEAKYVLSIVGVAALFGALAAGFIVDRIGPIVYLMIISSIACLALGVLGLNLFDPAAPIAIVMMALSGMGSTFGVAVSRLFGPAAFAPVMGLFSPFMMGSAFAGAAAGWCRDQFGNYQIVFGILSLAMLISIASALLLFSQKRRSQRDL